MSDQAIRHPAPDDLRAYGHGLPNEPDVAAMEDHLAACDACCRVLESASADEFLDRLRALRTPADIARPGLGPPAGWDEHPQFRIEREIGRGGMGVVYLARQVPLGRLVALKMLLGGERAGPKELIRFLAEAEIMAAVRHPHVVQVYECDEHAGGPYLAMEYLPGGSLAGRLKENGALEPRSAAELVQKLARAAQAAHEQGIVHRDLKPSNVLFDADGEPRVTDFGLAKRSAADLTRTQAVLGTPAYMAPEQTQGRGKFATPETDMWALGVILYECLTGARPFDASDAQAVIKQIAEHDPAPPHHPSSRTPQDLATICLKCLRKAPEKRYRTAQALADDLGAFLAGRSISARRPSLGERAARWSRRHPRLSTGLTVGLVALLLLIGPATVIAIRSNQLAARRQELARSEAVLAQQRAVRELRMAQTQLAGQAEKAMLIEGQDRSRRVLEQYSVADSGWADRSAVTLLSDRQRAELRTELGETLLLMAPAELLLAPERDTEAATRALGWNKLAERCYPADGRPRMLAVQRTRLLAVTGGGADPLPDPGPSAVDLYHEGVELAVGGKPGEALSKLVPYTDDHPDHFTAWFARGHSHEQVGQFTDAATAFTVCTTMWPDFALAHLRRGTARLWQGKAADAEADFTRALRYRPDWADALFNRGLAREAKNDYAGAEADLTAALEIPGTPTRIYFARALVREKLGDAAGAKADVAEGLKRPPADDVSWVTRGVKAVPTDPLAALADFEEALKLNPKSREALVAKAVVLANFLKRPADAAKALDRVLELYPAYTDARASRAVLLARLGDAKRATEDAAIVLKDEPTSYRFAQMAGMYAQLSKSDPTGVARHEALQYLAKAFRAGFVQFNLIDKDQDLDPLKEDPEFKELVRNAQALHQTRSGSTRTAPP